MTARSCWRAPDAATLASVEKNWLENTSRNRYAHASADCVTCVASSPVNSQCMLCKAQTCEEDE